MAFTSLNPDQFTEQGIFAEDTFLALIDQQDWSQFTDKKVLVRGCGSALIPPWAYMVITSRLMPFARSVRYGNEHDNLVIYRKQEKN